MSVVQLTYLQPGQRLVIKGQSNSIFVKKEVSVPILLETDSTHDQEAVISNHFAYSPALPYPGRYYAFDGLYDPTLICTELSCIPRDKNPLLWDIDAKYSPAGGDDEQEQKPNDDGKNTDNPYDWAPEIDITTTQIMEPVETAEYIKGYKGKADGILKGKVSKPRNSALIPFNPPIEREASQLSFRASRYYPKFDMSKALAYRDTINSAAIEVDNRYYSGTIKEGTAKMKSYGGVLQWKTWRGVTRPVWRVSVQIDIITGGLSGPKTWNAEIADMGTMRRTLEGDADGRGGTIAAADLIAKAVRDAAIKDRDGHPVSDPVPLDGDGQPQDFGTDATTVYGTWRIYNKTDLTPFFNLDLNPG